MAQHLGHRPDVIRQPVPPPGWPSDPYDPFRDLGDPPALNLYYGYDFYYYYGHFPA